jgi:hypothetical protein
MKQEIQELYELGLEKFAGDENAAKDFVAGFLKEAFFGNVVGEYMGRGLGQAAGGAVAGLGAGLAIHGVSSMMNAASSSNLRAKFDQSFQQAVRSNPLLQDADKAKLASYGDTIFKFAPHISADPNLLSGILAHIIQGEGVDVTILKTLTDLEAKLIESRKNSLFTPKGYL